MSRAALVPGVLVVLVWAVMLSFGGVAAETVLLYPNIFVDVPASLEKARDFMVAAGPSDYFRPLGAAVVLSALAAVVLTSRDPRLRWWVVGAAGVFVAAEFAFSVLYFWPRNQVMFVDPVGSHPPEELRRVAAEFVAGHRVRLAGGGVSAALAFTALLRWARGRAADREPVR